MRMVRLAVFGTLGLTACAGQHATAPHKLLRTNAAPSCWQPGVTDPSVCNDPQTVVTARQFTGQGGSGLGSANEFGASDQGTTLVTNSQNSYEKISRYSSLVHNDPSYYGLPGNQLRDFVGREVHAWIGPGNQSGRVWSYHGMAGSLPGGDGYAPVFEAESVNNGADAPDPTRTDVGYYGYHAIADGPQPSTAGYGCRSGGGYWHMCLYAPAGANEAAVQMGNSVPIIAELPTGQRVIFGYVNAGGWLVLGGPGLAGTAIWNSRGGYDFH